MNRTTKIFVAVVTLAAILWLRQPRSGSPPSTDTPSAAPQLQAKVIAFSCDPNLGRPRADLTIQNTGQADIEFPQATVQFGGGANRGYLRPYPLRPGGTASASIYSPIKAMSGCNLLSVQDRNGYSVSLK